jgi:primosomal protein N' (replication factor Y) (superfamily II helicase)
MTQRTTYFVDVVLPVPIAQAFTYRVPIELNVQICFGIRVIVPFGKNKRLTGIITKIHEIAPVNYQAKYVEILLDETPIITEKQFTLWSWISQYYLAPIGDVMNAALPSNFKLASETKVVIHPDYDPNLDGLSEKEVMLVNIVEERESIDLKELADIIEIKYIQPIIKRLIERRIIATQEEINQRYTPKTISCVQLEERYSNDGELDALFQNLENKAGGKKQLNALLELIKCAMELGGINKAVPKGQLLKKEVSASALSTLEKNGILRSSKVQIDRLIPNEKDQFGFKALSEPQAIALKEIEESFEQKSVTLLHGITGSGKTEIYVQLIQSYLDMGKQVLYLLPEIALTTQLIQRLSIYFGKQIGVYHSKFNQNERVEIWNKVLSNNNEEFRLIIGARSAVFLPYQNLGLIIVDEEHETSFKQHDPSPRYNARDTALILAHSHKAKTLLGSATPSFESYFNAKKGKYALVELMERYKGVELPEVFCADLKSERKLKTMHSNFSSMLLEEIENTLKKNEQVILFQNRRGYTPRWSCEVCTWSPKCTNCDVTLTYHKFGNNLKCHYCSYVTAPMGSCHACGSNRLKMVGFGTEKIEDDLAIHFPTARIKRMDLDTTRSKNAYSEIISDFENRKIDVLIGTQMLSKGLDFDNVTLVGIMDADMLLNRPDFRAFERSFQLMTQVAGRAGRKEKKGKVIIQTGQIDHWVIKKVIKHDFIEFYNNEIIERENFYYPPFYKMIVLTVKHKEEQVLIEAANELANALKNVFKERVLGPEFPIIKKIQNLFLKEIKIKYEKSLSDIKIKERIQALLNEFYAKPQNKSVRVVIDVDPN